jgi:glycosyltransferase involved in cell wall biosynthesis
MDPVDPVVSVVMATYNRSNVIGFSIESLLRCTFDRWELIVVGDACTDDTESVVAAFRDPRIRFVNLPQNFGEQSGPNNAGTRLARGRYIAFLNHDDLWLPDHLVRSVTRLDGDPGVDLVFGVGLAFYDAGKPPLLVSAPSQDSRYHPAMIVPASLWVMRRELMDRIGPWSPASTIVAAPSQDWLYRCYRAGARLAASRHLAAVIIGSATRKDSYRARLAKDHEQMAARMREPGFAADTLLQVPNPWEDARAASRASPFLSEALKIAVRKLFLALGLFPPLPRYWLRYGRKGALVRALRRTRGLPPQS